LQVSSKLIKSVIAAVVLIVSIVGVLIGKPVIDQTVCEIAGGIYDGGICYPAPEEAELQPEA
jgi:hypothetical protein